MSGTLSQKNRVVIASAGSRKTTYLVEEALAHPDERILITTYTNENIDQIRRYLIDRHGCIPGNVTVLSWYSVLLQHHIRPYQRSVTDRPRIESILFENLPLYMRKVRKADPNKYYFSPGGYIYQDRAAEFAHAANQNSGGAVIGRLARIYDRVFIDELQDFAGYDLHILESFFRSPIKVLAVGDPRQATFSTNNSRMNSRYRGSDIVDWLSEKEAAGLCALEERTACYRCNQDICNFADAIFPGWPGSISQNVEVTGHDGLFYITPDELPAYIAQHNPTGLRYNKVAKTLGIESVNIGKVKGRTYDRVVVFPTQSWLTYLKTKDLSKASSIEKLYVAVTRARFSVAFVVPKAPARG